MAANRVGRPTKYTPEMLTNTEWYVEHYNSDLNQAIPTIAGLAKHLGLYKSTVEEWSNHKDRPEFSRLVEELLQEQELVLLTYGLNNTFNASITKLVLNKHQYNDKVEVEANVNNVVTTKVLRYDGSRDDEE